MTIRWTNKNPPVPQSVPDQLAQRCQERLVDPCHLCAGQRRVDNFGQNVQVDRKHGDMFHAMVTLTVVTKCLDCGDIFEWKDTAY